jgi:hypothetical protein
VADHPLDPHVVRNVVDELANGLQVIYPLAVATRQQAAGAMKRALDMEVALGKMMDAIDRLKPTPENEP